MQDEKLKETVETRKSTNLDQLMQIIEISFIFLVTFSLIALADSAINRSDLYKGIALTYLGERDVGSLRGGNYEEIVRITLIFNLMLFAFSLFFGIWIRRTRDNWSWSDFGYSFSTKENSFIDLVRRGIILGLIASAIYFIILTPLSFFINGSEDGYLIFAYSDAAGKLYSNKALQAEYYFGIVEMGFIWPASAGFFFFAYAYNSLKSKFPTGVANILSTIFYVFYLIFFFIISGGAKISGLIELLTHPAEYIVAWFNILVLLIVLYINFSSFAETKSIVVPFTMNFVFNVGLTVLRSANSIIFRSQGSTPIMIILPIILILTIIIWFFLKKEDFSTIKLGIKHITELEYSPLKLIAFFLLFVSLSFILPGIINELLYKGNTLDYWVIPVLYAFNFLLIILLSVIVLTYEPTEVYDVLLVSNDGIPLRSKIELFETDDVLISGFFTAIASVDEELSSDSGLKSIKRGSREILIESGVNTRLIILADKDQKDIRRNIQRLFRDYEVNTSIEEIENVKAGITSENSDKLVSQINELSNLFSIPTQTKWIATLASVLGPVMILLIGLV